MPDFENHTERFFSFLLAYQLGISGERERERWMDGFFKKTHVGKDPKICALSYPADGQVAMGD